MLKKFLKVDKDNTEYVESLPKIYLVNQWLEAEVFEFPFTGEFEFDKYMLNDVPLVYQSGKNIESEDVYILRKIINTMPGLFIAWTTDREDAYRIADEENARCDT